MRYGEGVDSPCGVISTTKLSSKKAKINNANGSNKGYGQAAAVNSAGYSPKNANPAAERNRASFPKIQCRGRSPLPPDVDLPIIFRQFIQAVVRCRKFYPDIANCRSTSSTVLSNGRLCSAAMPTNFLCNSGAIWTDKFP